MRIIEKEFYMSLTAVRRHVKRALGCISPDFSVMGSAVEAQCGKFRAGLSEEVYVKSHSSKRELAGIRTRKS